MQCPLCNLDQVIVEFQGVELDLCVAGHGIWFDRDELAQLFERAGAPEQLLELEGRLSAAEKTRGRRRCPRCFARMAQVAWRHRDGPVVLDACRHGHGLWFDAGELEQILGAALGPEDPALARVQGFLQCYRGGGKA